METQELLQAALKKARTRDNLASVAAVNRRQVSRWFNEGVELSPRSYGALLKYVNVPIGEVRRLVAERAMNPASNRT